MDTLTTRMAVVVEAAIESAGQTPFGVSERTGIPRTTLLRRLRGGSSFTLAELESIAKVLAVTVDDLIAAAQDAA